MATKNQHAKQPNRFRRSILLIYLCILTLGFAYVIWLKLTGIGIPCLFYLTTGLLCPGCGISRMFLAMLRLDFAAAFQFNPLSFCLFFIWNLIAVLVFWGKPKFIRSSRFLYGALSCSVASSLIFCVLRNIF